MTAREAWKIYYRMIRVARREALKATMDMVFYGTGAVMIPGNSDDPKHIPFADLRLEEYAD